MSGARTGPTGLSGGQAALALARLAIVRASRGKALWVGVALMVLPIIPVVVAASLHEPAREIWEDGFNVCLLVLPILPAILVAASLADELEDKTAAYLWSRALPRWAIIGGKLLGLAPIIALIMGVGVTAIWAIAGGAGALGADTLVWALLGVAAGAVAASAVSGMWATLVPRHAVAVSVAWLLVLDLPIGALSMKLHYLSASYGARALAGLADRPLDGVIAIAIILVITIAVAAWRITRIE